ncbi:indolepyruvate ferredoxin oxidoreductase (plasmid) [Burkholderia sp. SFA1]|uniref:indolepyruvate ferredoxin oxidoreductase family protein n=1 Tax=unclassified Caballeronia TaxID=2646786 RepID=UPI001F1EEB49|nr:MULTISPECIES: indolepyruvate ferredoxin oxidoreductase family protein [unclassified Caballeronia]MCE4547132.1 indolepyruvate ferredoxin oxidoreductase family protein [Caballeronia sp. PC1]MCE4572395.1 indolepyruvate ferredoxin oxidoreductase family protein [Caballeronia sp. CLC5]BBQ02237.1 indolepyruvate ferredoxin oxidoreductase [Burkholderia sp. SFA1]
MNAPDRAALAAATDVSLDDKYTLEKGRVYISGTQALVRLPMLQKARDRRAGLNTAGFISGYRGSPLGALDQSLWKAKQHLKDNDIVFQPGVNEDLAATSIWGTQQVNLWPGATRDGVFGMWYGKGPGVDRTGDVFKHANSAGTDKHGGVLVLAGDDHAAKSSSVAHQSDHAFIAAGIPVLYPSNVQEYLDYGLHGWAMSRYSGLWVAMKCVTDVVESTASIDLDPDRVEIVTPADYAMPAEGLNIRWPDSPLAQEARLLDEKWYAALAYVRANKLNRVVLDSDKPRFGIITAGKAYLDVRQALVDLGLDDETCAQIGLRVLKVGCVWPLDAQDARAFATGLEEILVVEEKRQILEYALKEELYNWREDVRPRIYGKFDERDNEGGEWSVPRGDWLLPAHYELSPALIAKAIARRLARADLPADVRARMLARVETIEAKEREAVKPRVDVERKPWFCSGCPHNTSTRVPEGSRALAGIGCHYMSMWMDRKTETFSQMGGEGVAWIGQMHFSGDKHVFVNLGDGTYFHSGLLAVRAAIAANANITYKILYNDAVAMTGGQPVDGVLTVPQIAHQVYAEGAKRIVIVTDEPQKYDAGVALPDGVNVHHRDELDRIQRELRDTQGTTILIYDQTCATEKRRRRKRGTYPDPARRAFINDAVCEGCGDCSVQSNCLSVEPMDTPLGTKRKINQSSCNKDFSCVKGFCPSFVTAEGAQVRKPRASKETKPDFDKLPSPSLPALSKPYGILVTGVGGTGVVTIGGLIGMAAHIERKGVTVLDMAGLAQKGGAVLSHVQIAPEPRALHATRIATGEARLVIGCDAIVSASNDVLSRTRNGVTQAAINSGATPTAGFVTDANWTFPAAQTEQALQDSIGAGCAFIDANALALKLLGDTIYSNPLLLGFAWQKGWLPLELASLKRAIELNNVAVEKNVLAFNWGRFVAQHGVGELIKPAQHAIVMKMPESLENVIATRETLLTAYQSEAYARSYRSVVERMREKEKSLNPKLPLTRAVAKNLAKLMAYKDEYEVARLYADPAYLDKLREQFEGEPGRDYKLMFHLAPPLFAKHDEHGHLVKQRFGAWMLPAFRVLAKMKGLRGTSLDVFGKTEERRTERAMIADYIALVDEFCATLDADRFDTALQLAKLPDEIRGFGHVKARNMAAVASKRERLIGRYRAPVELAATA